MTRGRTTMWTFRDEEGRKWEMVVGRESWGGFVVLFIPEDGDPGIRQTAVEASSQGEANRRVDELGRGGWLNLLDRSRPKEME